MPVSWHMSLLFHPTMGTALVKLPNSAQTTYTWPHAIINAELETAHWVPVVRVIDCTVPSYGESPASLSLHGPGEADWPSAAKAGSRPVGGVRLGPD